MRLHEGKMARKKPRHASLGLEIKAHFIKDPPVDVHSPSNVRFMFRSLSHEVRDQLLLLFFPTQILVTDKLISCEINFCLFSAHAKKSTKRTEFINKHC